jgi:SAM-dependent methyltransferase
MAVPDEIRPRLHEMWAGVAPAWREHAKYIDERGEVVTRRMLELADPRPGERVLELACGPGGLGLAAASRVAPDGEVVLSDVVPEMTATATARGRELGLGNVGTRVLDLEEIAEPDESYDLVLCREGLMFALDPARAAREIRRVLRPGGRFAIAVWGPQARNPWLGIVLDAASEQFGAPVPPPGIPGPFALEDRDRFAELFEQAGFSDVAIGELDVPTYADSFEQWWARTCALAGPLANMLAALPEQAANELRERARRAVHPYQHGERLEFPATTLIATGRRA